MIRETPTSPKGVRSLGIAALALAAIGAVVLLVGEASTRRPNVVLILVDTLRADCVDPDAADPPMPFLSAQAERAVFYERAYAPTSWTLPSVASLFLAKRPSEHGIGPNGWWSSLPETGPTIATAFRDGGYATVARVAHAGLSANRVGRGFDDFEVVAGGPLQSDALAVNRAVLEWLEARPSEASPFLLYLHYVDVHGPYRVHPKLTARREPGLGRSDKRIGSLDAAKGLLMASEEERRRAWTYAPAELARMRQLYDGECRYVDRQLERLFGAFEERGLLEESIVVVTSDHGEELGAHGVFAHGGSLFGAAVRVPLIVRLPDGEAERVHTPVGIGGLGPALLREVGLPVAPGLRIPPLPLRADDARTATAYVELLPSHLEVRMHARGIVSDASALLVAEDGSHALFALDDEGLESQRIDDAARTDRLRATMQHIQSGLAKPGHVPTRRPDALQQQQLRALGYLE